ncbi:MAG: hypothetical protein CFE29_14130 [Bradyrhizobiaceae bacterium PARB1]|jgi:hypothetical protein|nr:MAG: hypothetical protein CFE29_14130 [Bradyrhizobiaceae bacterium PARB1]
MTAGMIIGLILLPFAWMLMAAANKMHRDETGVNAPTRDAMRRIRRNARKKGISEAEAYNQWLNRKTPKLRNSAIAYAPDTRIKHSPPAIVEDPEDELLKAAATLQLLSLKRQSNGLYYFLNFGSGPEVMIKNPARPTSYDFTRDEVETYLTQNAGIPRTTVAARGRTVALAHEDELSNLATARNWSLHRQANGKYYILNLNRSPTAYVTFPENLAKHQFTLDEVRRLLSQ